MQQVKAQRQSNIELLRIVTMLMVIILHSSFMATGAPSVADFHVHPISSAYFSWIEALTIVCVDCYILISGYFGIKPTLKKFLNLWFIIAFWRMSILLVGHFYIGVPLTAKAIFQQLNLFGNGWFVGSYMALFVLAYFLNIFCERSTKDEFKKGLIVYLIVMLLLGWIVPSAYFKFFNFANGYSVFSFIGIYLIGRYIRLHIDTSRIRASKIVATYLACGTINAVLFLIMSTVVLLPFVVENRTNWFVSYDNPLTIIGAICLLLAFLKINVNSKVINWLAASSFAVFLIHVHPISMVYFKECAHFIKSAYWPWGWLPMITLFAVALYVACVILDQIRIYLWRLLERTVSTVVRNPNKS